MKEEEAICMYLQTSCGGGSRGRLLHGPADAPGRVPRGRRGRHSRRAGEEVTSRRGRVDPVGQGRAGGSGARRHRGRGGAAGAAGAAASRRRRVGIAGGSVVVLVGLVLSTSRHVSGPV